MSKKIAINKNYITVNTDAGFKDGLVTYCIWITSNFGRFKYYGRAKNLYEDSSQGELIAICIAIKYLVENHIQLFKTTDILLFNTDSIVAINVLKNKINNEKYKDMKVYFNTLLQQLQKEKKFQVCFKHVKGHSSNSKGARFYVNNWCDSMSRQVRTQHET